jgi:hypothetical protein
MDNGLFAPLDPNDPMGNKRRGGVALMTREQGETLEEALKAWAYDLCITKEDNEEEYEKLRQQLIADGYM